MSDLWRICLGVVLVDLWMVSVVEKKFLGVIMVDWLLWMEICGVVDSGRLIELVRSVVSR